MNENLNRQLIEEANAAHERFLGSASTAADRLIEMVNAGREVGIRILSIRDNNRNWEQLTLGMLHDPGQQSLTFDKQHAKAFLRMADRMPEPATTMADAVVAIKDAFMLQGTLPFPDGHGQQQLHEHDPAGYITLCVMKIQATFNKELRDTIPTMDPVRRRNLAEQIKPAWAIYNALVAC